MPTHSTAISTKMYSATARKEEETRRYRRAVSMARSVTSAVMGRARAKNHSAVGRVEGDQIFIQADRKAVQKQREVNGQPGIHENGDGRHPQDDAGSDDIERPGGGVENQQVQKAAGKGGGDQGQGVKKDHALCF